MDPVDRLILDEAPEPAGRVLVVDAPELAAAALARGWDVVGYADSLLVERAYRVPVLDSLPSPMPPSSSPSRPDSRALSPSSFPVPPSTSLPELDFPTRTQAGKSISGREVLAEVDLVLLRLPKSVAALEEYAQRLAWLPGVRIVAGGRVKHMTPAMNTALATRFGSVRASLGRQKSRVLHAGEPGPGPIDFPRTAHHPDWELTLAAHGATFAGIRIDPGTRLLLSVLDRLPAPDADSLAIDLGSGNGTLSVLLARAGHRVLALDESRAGCLATVATADRNGVEVEVQRADGLGELAAGSTGLIVCNPPFHVGTAKDSTPALAMIADAGRVLRPGGELWLVFNAHLPYLPQLRRHIGRTQIVARNQKYLVTRSSRP